MVRELPALLPRGHEFFRLFGGSAGVFRLFAKPWENFALDVFENHIQ